LSFFAVAQQKLKFIVNYPGSAPYLYFDQKAKNYQGIIVDILKDLRVKKQLDIRFVADSRLRSEEALYQGKVDLTMLSTTWLKDPNKVIATIPLLTHRSYLYSTKAIDPKFDLNNLSEAKSICTRQGYSYPNLKPYFNTKKLIRLDSSMHITMLRMLFKRRCNYAIFNEYNALSLMKEKEFAGNKIYHGKYPISEVPLNIILRPELTKEKDILDKHIKN